jgi:hypothetical protein
MITYVIYRYKCVTGFVKTDIKSCNIQKAIAASFIWETLLNVCDVLSIHNFAFPRYDVTSKKFHTDFNHIFRSGPTGIASLN